MAKNSLFYQRWLFFQGLYVATANKREREATQEGLELGSKQRKEKKNHSRPLMREPSAVAATVCRLFVSWKWLLLVGRVHASCVFSITSNRRVIYGQFIAVGRVETDV